MTRPDLLPGPTSTIPSRLQPPAPVEIARPEVGIDIHDEDSGDAIARGVIRVPREVITGVSGSLRLDELPERAPEIVMLGAGRSRNADDE